MTADGWAAWAAWIGAGLGIVNFVITAISRQPNIHFTLDATAHVDRLGLRYSITAGPRPVMMTSLHILPGRRGTQVFLADGEATMFRDIMRWQEKGKFSCHVPANETKEIVISFEAKKLPKLLILKWSDQRLQLFPFYFKVISIKMFDRIIAAQPLIGRRL